MKRNIIIDNEAYPNNAKGKLNIVVLGLSSSRSNRHRVSKYMAVSSSSGFLMVYRTVTLIPECLLVGLCYSLAPFFPNPRTPARINQSRTTIISDNFIQPTSFVFLPLDALVSITAYPEDSAYSLNVSRLTAHFSVGRSTLLAHMMMAHPVGAACKHITQEENALRCHLNHCKADKSAYPLYFLDPPIKIVERVPVADIEHHQRPLRLAEEGRCHGAKPLLSRRVPHLAPHGRYKVYLMIDRCINCIDTCSFTWSPFITTSFAL